MDAITRSAPASPSKAAAAPARDADSAFGGALAGLLGSRAMPSDDADVGPIDMRDDESHDTPASDTDDDIKVSADPTAPAVLLPWLAQSRAIAVEPMAGGARGVRVAVDFPPPTTTDPVEPDPARERRATLEPVDVREDARARRRDDAPTLSPALRPPRFSFAPVPVPTPPPASVDAASPRMTAVDLAALADAIDAAPPTPTLSVARRGAHATREAATPAAVRTLDDAPVDTRIALGKADEGFGIALRGAASPEAPAPSQGGWISIAGPAMRGAAPAPAVVDPSPVADAEAWSQALAKHTMLLATGDLKEARLQIEGRQLGPIEVSVRLDGERVDVRFAIQHPITAMLVQDALPRLERMLEHQGLSLGQSSVDQGQAQAQANAQQRDGRHAAAEVRFGATSHGATGVDSEVVSAPRTRAAPLGLLDDFA